MRQVSMFGESPREEARAARAASRGRRPPRYPPGHHRTWRAVAFGASAGGGDLVSGPISYTDALGLVRRLHDAGYRCEIHDDTEHARYQARGKGKRR